MVTSVTNLGRSGLSDWLIQRVSAVVLLAYVIFLSYVLLACSPDYQEWKALFENTCMRIFSVAALLAIAMHAWIGLWSVSTDYLTERTLGGKATLLRLSFQAISAAVLFTYVVWGIQILWS
ncbi:succinate dehydrogenase, hydrophobic membrane anchor protein [Dasania sp. GY-MA-18]|uniref:Succinate dehydrogenase hydrophobic membrane anchor subunit n=1 Tax=Dasania phycosphaerae TaxID=2950436 RepID=A0A9J6RLZ6_9GAMM|nr:MULTISPECIES: succinate dehydrogenase, hydrophobic membrane anchor protein [Dasania]MCR8922906.1 succinate dehydrogenase, hydrophobic membrane anchor protein [Dasania sp. GY-MA-18]MCZ0865337.1 succinate dehydrogenase, hydrophobic membrane anchor protein [Dasania phycosphaerae]MCZ0869062.1 succinate dehydrogenase, hydrophobic membrane anchor protein [Dasania phycosphaerae]